MSRFRNHIGGVLCVAGVLLGGGCGSAEFSATSFLNAYPPALPEAGTWLNADAPLRLDALRGRVVWLEFGFLN